MADIARRLTFAALLLFAAALAGCSDDRGHNLVLRRDDWGCAMYAQRTDRQRPTCVAWVDLEWVAQKQDKVKSEKAKGPKP